MTGDQFLGFETKGAGSNCHSEWQNITPKRWNPLPIASTRQNPTRGVPPSLGHVGCSPDCKDQVCRSRVATATQRLLVASP